MSGIIVNWISLESISTQTIVVFGIGNYIRQLLLRNNDIERQRLEIRSDIDFMTVLDVMSKEYWPTSIECVEKEIIEAVKHERFSRRYIPNDAGSDRAALSYFPADIRISGSSERSYIPSEIVCPEKEKQSFGLDATEKQSNELPNLSISMAVYLWRGRRHQRRRICDVWIAP